MSLMSGKRSRKAAAAGFSYAEPASSSDEDDYDESPESTRQATKRGKGKVSARRTEDSSDEDAHPRKKARKGKSEAKGKGKAKANGGGKGGPNLLDLLPPELVAEIFSHLDTPDLLSLSQVNKQYRALLTAKASKRLWVEARKDFNLPDLAKGDIEEWQYASLFFDDVCQSCSHRGAIVVDCFLRSRLCKTCRKVNPEGSCTATRIVKLETLDRINPKLKAKLHPLAVDCVIRTPACASVDDLEYFSAVLRDLEDQDEDSDIAEGRSDLPSPSRVPSGEGFRRFRSRHSSKRVHASKRWSKLQDIDSDIDDDGDSARPSQRIVNFIADRKVALKQYQQDGEALSCVARDVKDKKRALRDATARAAQREKDLKRYSSDSRPAQIRRAVLALDLDYDPRSFMDTPSWNSNKLVKSDLPLTEDEWSRIKPQILELIDRQRSLAQRLKDKNNLWKRQLSQQKSLRKRYDGLLQSLSASARPFAPLFVDFLLLPAVKALWEPGTSKPVAENDWLRQLDGIKEELEQYRLELGMHARATILEATVDPKKRNPDDDEDDLDLQDDFFALATSFVCCSFKNCPTRDQKHCVWDPRQSRSWQHYKTITTTADSPNKRWLGPLVEVLEHAHEKHNEAVCLKHKKDLKRDPQFRFQLPLEVACGMSAILELNDLDPATAGKRELDHVETVLREYEWENAASTRRKVHSRGGRPAWLNLLTLIKREGERLGRMRPPATLDPPCIVIRRNKSEKLEPLSDDDDENEDDIDGDGEDDEAPRKKKGKRPASVFESDEGDEDE
ncbi:hypothetical protein Rhopal_006452-T1 [Rhodotorula paludigena]|uniref:F-box domain-containing protein n=1 Tax=Rhodotorula paludigena TaxID=86838 RepID=A0AAV5GWI8_9BASI|nr:hypothetical protein Rhopal_006452-T1 [Rhodotorula paludigena]